MSQFDARTRGAEAVTGPRRRDHLHTRATGLAGVASKVEDGSSAPSSRRRGGAPARRLGALALVTLAVLLGGGAAFEAAPRPAQVADPTANEVFGFGGAPPIGPRPGLDAHAPLVDAAVAADDGYWLVALDGGVFAFGSADFRGSLGGTRLNAPVVGIARARGGDGYWLAAADGGVFSFGTAPFLGSLGGAPLASPILDIAPTPSGRGFWLVAADGGVFAFGDARFHGAAAGFGLTSPVVGIAPTPSGGGYWLVAADGGVFAFGDAPFRGARVDSASPAVAIAATRGGGGYWVARADGSIDAFGAPDHGDPAAGGVLADGHPVVDVLGRAGGGYWAVVGEQMQFPVAPSAPDISGHPFLVCTRRHESDTSGGYRAVSASGTYRGAYQFSRSTWDNTARHAGRSDLVGVDPAAAAPHDQDTLALHLYHWQGASPWLGRCAGR